MALTYTLPFLQTGSAANCVAVGVLTSTIASGTGAADLFNPTTDGSKLWIIGFVPCEPVSGGYLHIYQYNGSTNILVRTLKIPDTWNLEDQIIWINPENKEIAADAAIWKVGQSGTNKVIHAKAWTANY